jgi:signal peptidase I
MLGMLLGAAVVIIVGFGVSRRLGLFVVQGNSMAPVLREGDWVLAGRSSRRRRARTGDVVIYTREGAPPVLIKRVLAEPGEVLPAEISVTESRLPAGRYFLESDNPANAQASRGIGPVEGDQIWGKALAVVWPWRRWGRVRRGDRRC